MCLAVFTPANVAPKEEYLHNGWVANPDGGGFAYVRRGQVKVVKHLMHWKDWFTEYNKAKANNKDSPFLIHFRIRSAGSKGADNTHPFKLPTGAMIHNGTIQGSKCNYVDGDSDTRLFVDAFKDQLTYDNMRLHGKELEDAIGYNKLVFLFNGGKHVIINEKEGQWHEGAWYSNGSFRSYAGGRNRTWS